jgi:Tfp pilus assembly protein PilF
MRTCLLLLLISILASTGCSRLRRPSSLYSTVFGEEYNVAKAESAHNIAIDCICEGDFGNAEQLLRDALICDPSNGAIHNTLGKVYFQKREYYQAAWEFEYAQNALPGRSEPLNNMGMVYEAVDDFEQAIQYYEMALSSDGDNPEYLGNLVRARVRSGDRSMEVHDLLKRLIAIDHRASWIDWARGQLVFWNKNVSNPETGKEPFYEDISAHEFTSFFDGAAPAQLPAIVRPEELGDTLELPSSTDKN